MRTTSHVSPPPGPDFEWDDFATGDFESGDDDEA